MTLAHSARMEMSRRVARLLTAAVMLPQSLEVALKPLNLLVITLGAVSMFVMFGFSQTNFLLVSSPREGLTCKLKSFLLNMKQCDTHSFLWQVGQLHIDVDALAHLRLSKFVV